MTQGKTHREPLLRIAKRDGIARPKAWAIRIIAVLLSLVVSGIFIFAVTKLNPFQVYEGIFDGAFGTPRRSWVTVRDAMMLLCIGVGLAPAFKMRFWNIGAEGQILIGGIVTAGFMRAFGGDISTPLLLVIMAVVSLLAGAAWGMVPATFKAVWNTNETLFTLMMNYIMIGIFLGLTAYDMQKMRAMYYACESEPAMLDKISIYSALDLYLDFINIFLYVLRILGRSQKN